MPSNERAANKQPINNTIMVVLRTYELGAKEASLCGILACPCGNRPSKNMTAPERVMDLVQFANRAWRNN